MNGSLQSIVEGLGRRLQRTVALHDAQSRLTAHWSVPGAPMGLAFREMVVFRRWPPAAEGWIRDRQRQVNGFAAVPPNDDLGVPRLLGCPVVCNRQVIGMIWIVETAKASGVERAVLQSTAQVLGDLLYRQRVLLPPEQELAETLIRPLLLDEPDRLRRNAEALTQSRLLVDTDRYSVLVATLRGAGQHGLTVADQTSLQLAHKDIARHLPLRHSICVMWPDSALIVLALDRRTQTYPEVLAARLVQAVNSKIATGESHAVVGVGDEVDAIEKLPRSYQQACMAAQLAQTISSVGPIASWSQLGVYRFLIQFPSGRDLERDMPPGVVTLLSDPDAASLVETLDAYFRLGGDAQRTAAELRLHKGTLYDRLHRLERMTGLNLRNGEDRLVIHLCLRLAQVWSRSDRSAPDSDAASL